MRRQVVAAADIVGDAAWEMQMAGLANRGKVLPMCGDLLDNSGAIYKRGGFQADFLANPAPVGPPIPLGLQRGWGSGSPAAHLSDRARGLLDRMERAAAGELDLQRSEGFGDIQQLAIQLGTTVAEIARGVTSTMTAFPVRENLEAESKILIPLETPVRNRLPRTPGAGVATQWRQTTSLGGGWDNTLDQPGSAAAARAFFAEDGAPLEHTTVYVAKSLGYKLLGTFGSVTAFAMAA